MDSLAFLLILMDLTGSVIWFWVMCILVITVFIGIISFSRITKSKKIFLFVAACFLFSWSILEIILGTNGTLIQITDHTSAIFPASLLENEITGFHSSAVKYGLDGSDNSSEATLTKFKNSTDWKITLIIARRDEHAGGSQLWVKVKDLTRKKVGVIYAAGDHSKVYVLGSFLVGDNSNSSNANSVMGRIARRYGLIRPYELTKFRTLVIFVCIFIPLIYFLRLISFGSVIK